MVELAEALAWDVVNLLWEDYFCNVLLQDKFPYYFVAENKHVFTHDFAIWQGLIGTPHSCTM